LNTFPRAEGPPEDHEMSENQQPVAGTPEAAEAAEADTAGIGVTEKAVEQIREIRDREGLEAHLLRVSVVGGGCSGLSYKMGFVETANEHDIELEKGGVRLVVDPKSALYLEGVVIDFTDGLNGKGFTFNNPNAVRTCGCGSSFSA
jgi:iron-sulfur cluster assembly protein